MDSEASQPSSTTLKQMFDLSGRVVVITGGAGMLGAKHAEAVAELGAVAVLVDIAADAAMARADALARRFNARVVGIGCDITSEAAVTALGERLARDFGRVDVLINNAANNPTMAPDSGMESSRLESFSLAQWHQDIAVGLTGAFLCSRTLGAIMAAHGKGVILNIASDLALIAPDQRLYRQPGLADDEQPVKPVSYSVVKAGIVGLTRYLATYWPGRVRANALAPGGVYDGQSAPFVAQISTLIPLGRMAHRDEYKGAIAFLVSDASSYMNGAVLSVDGGRTSW